MSCQISISLANKIYNVPSSDPMSLSSCSISPSLVAPDIYSSSESIWLVKEAEVVVSGVGGFSFVVCAEAEAIFLLERVSLVTLDVIASAFRFLDRGGMMSGV